MTCLGYPEPDPDRSEAIRLRARINSLLSQMADTKPGYYVIDTNGDWYGAFTESEVFEYVGKEFKKEECMIVQVITHCNNTL